MLSEIYYPELTSTGYFLTKIAESLAQKFSICVITGPATIELKSTTSPWTETINGVKIYRSKSTTFDRNWLPGRLINMVITTLSIFLKGLWYCKQQDTILVVTNPPLLPFVALLLKWIKRCDFILLIHDVYPEVLIVTGFASQKSPIVRIFSHLNRLLYQKAYKIITLGRDMSDLAQKKLPKNHHLKIKCIPNWADTEFAFPIPRTENSILRELGLVNHFVILYAGNIGRTHNIEIIAEAAKFFHLKEHKIHFLFIGSGGRKAWLEKFIHKESLSNTTILPFRPNSEKAISINACDVAIISFNPGMLGVSVPSRMYNQMAVGKPIIAIAHNRSELAKVIHEENIGWVVDPLDFTTLIDTIQYAYHNSIICSQMGERASKVVNEKYSYQHASTDYQNFLSE